MTHGSGGKYTEGTVNPASTAYRLSEDMLVKNKSPTIQSYDKC